MPHLRQFSYFMPLPTPGILNTIRVLCGTVCGSLLLNSSALADVLDERIARVEHGLRLPLVIKGVSTPGMELSARMQHWKVPGLSIALVNDGKLEWVRAYGVLAAGDTQPLRVDTPLQAASISKLAVAAALLHQVQQGALDLDADLRPRLKDLQLGTEIVEPLTIRHLLSHTAGAGGAGLSGYSAGQTVPVLSLALRGQPPANSPPLQLKGKPGATYRYSSSAYGLLQWVVAGDSSDDFEKLMQGHLLNPLRMTHSSFRQPESPAKVARGHDLSGLPLKSGWHVYPELAAAGLWSTPADLAQLILEIQKAAAGQTNKLFSAPIAKQMLTPVLGGYGLGVELGQTSGQAHFSHSGSNAGYKSQLFAYRDSGRGVVIMTNGDYGTPLIEEVLRSVAAEYGWVDYRQIEKTRVAVSPERLARYAGEYLVSGITLTVTHEHGRLFISGPPIGPERQELFAEVQDRFFMLNKDAALRFILNPADADAPVKEVIFRDGRERPGMRKEAKAP